MGRSLASTAPSSTHSSTPSSASRSKRSSPEEAQRTPIRTPPRGSPVTSPLQKSTRAGKIEESPTTKKGSSPERPFTNQPWRYGMDTQKTKGGASPKKATGELKHGTAHRGSPANAGGVSATEPGEGGDKSGKKKVGGKVTSRIADYSHVKSRVTTRHVYRTEDVDGEGIIPKEVYMYTCMYIHVRVGMYVYMYVRM